MREREKETERQRAKVRVCERERERGSERVREEYLEPGREVSDLVLQHVLARERG